MNCITTATVDFSKKLSLDNGESSAKGAASSGNIGEDNEAGPVNNNGNNDNNRNGGKRKGKKANKK